MKKIFVAGKKRKFSMNCTSNCLENNIPMNSLSISCTAKLLLNFINSEFKIISGKKTNETYNTLNESNSAIGSLKTKHKSPAQLFGFRYLWKNRLTHCETHSSLKISGPKTC